MSDKCRVAFELCKKRSEHLFDAEVQRCSKCYEKEDDYDACVNNGDEIFEKGRVLAIEFKKPIKITRNESID